MSQKTWANSVTWQTALWIENTEASADFYRPIIEECRTLPRRIATDILARTLEEKHYAERPDVPGVWNDMLSSALAEVNWNEIATYLIDEV